ncbi:hypothetical protein E4T44_02162 [Aureobasidium sp. EXF-8845]|nr:hypothetical protein E4T44_02162 [Aureobasidium sp. EXF-8845]KAI4856393.1 hypothetical protein E4T45_02148 [Aureobasidium sp. EXF-8846]
MISTPVLIAILTPIAIYLVIAATILFVLGCAMYVYIIKFRQLANRVHRKLKLRYWREKTFDFLGLPPEIRLMIYRYTLPEDRTYYMTARKYRFYGHLPHVELRDEISPQPLSLLRVCRQIYQELQPLVYDDCVFYITIYSIRDLLYTIDLLDKYAVPHNFDHNRDIFFHMRNIRIRVSDLILDIYPYHRICHRYAWTKFSEAALLWIGPGKAKLLKDATQFAEMTNAGGITNFLQNLFEKC